MPDNDTSRLDRIERALELFNDDHVQFREQHKLLLTAQAALSDRLNRLTTSVELLTPAQQRTGQNLDEATERLNALIQYIEDLKRRPQGLSGPPSA